MSIRKEGHIDPKADQQVISRELHKELQRIGMEAERTMIDYLQKHGIDDRGDLRKSITSEVTTQLDLMRLRFGANAKHAIFVHDGTKPHWIGKDTEAGKSIRRWVIRKLSVTGEKKISSVSYLVRRKIAKKGTKGKPFAEATMRLISRTAPMKIDAAIQRGIRNAS